MNMNRPDLARLSMVVHGHVQGVFFRHSAAEEAHELGLTGWVRNLAHGDVEILAEGPRRELRIFAAWAHQGPRLARVSGVDEQWSEYGGELKTFTIR
jgi:acylphosphatase